MLSPDVSSTQVQMQAQVSAAQQVTQYCQAVQTLLPAYASAITDPDLSTTLFQVVSDVGAWSDLCANYTGQIPDLFVGFSKEFNTANRQMQDNLQTLQTDSANAAAKNQLEKSLSDLTTKLEALGKTATSVSLQLASFQSLTQKDHDVIDSALSQLATTMPSGPATVKAVVDTLGVNFFSSNQLSPCIAIVEINSQISVNLTTVAGNSPQFIPVVMAKSLLQSLLGINESAEKAISALLNTWNALIAKYQSVLTDLNKAVPDGLSAILAMLDLQDSLMAWNQLAAFASSLLPANETVLVSSL